MEHGDLTFCLVDNTLNTSSEAATPAPAHHASCGCRCSRSSHLMRCPMLLHLFEAANTSAHHYTAHPFLECSGLIIHLVANTLSASYKATAPLLTRRTSWGSQHSCSCCLMRLSMPLLVALHGVDNVLACCASFIGRLPTPLPAMCPLSVDSGLALQVVANHSSTIRLLATTPIPTHCVTSREGLESMH